MSNTRKQAISTPQTDPHAQPHARSGGTPIVETTKESTKCKEMRKSIDRLTIDEVRVRRASSKGAEQRLMLLQEEIASLRGMQTARASISTQREMSAALNLGHGIKPGPLPENCGDDFGRQEKEMLLKERDAMNRLLVSAASEIQTLVASEKVWTTEFPCRPVGVASELGADPANP
jgi:hypothetical protein